MTCHDTVTPDPDSELCATPEVVQLLVANHRAFLRFLQRKVGSRQLAEDILQEAFVRGLNKLGQLRSDEAVVAWFYRMLRNSVIDHYRRRDASNRAMEAFATELDAHAQEALPEVHGAICRCVASLAGTLKPEYADALQKIEIEGLRVKDYAEHASISSSHAAVRVFRAREALRKQVTRSCGTCAEHGCLDCTCDVVSRAAGESRSSDVDPKS